MQRKRARKTETDAETAPVPVYVAPSLAQLPAPLVTQYVLRNWRADPRSALALCSTNRRYAALCAREQVAYGGTRMSLVDALRALLQRERVYDTGARVVRDVLLTYLLRQAQRVGYSYALYTLMPGAQVTIEGATRTLHNADDFRALQGEIRARYQDEAGERDYRAYEIESLSTVYPLLVGVEDSELYVQAVDAPPPAYLLAYLTPPELSLQGNRIQRGAVPVEVMRALLSDTLSSALALAPEFAEPPSNEFRRVRAVLHALSDGLVTPAQLVRALHVDADAALRDEVRRYVASELRDPEQALELQMAALARAVRLGTRTSVDTDEARVEATRDGMLVQWRTDVPDYAHAYVHEGTALLPPVLVRLLLAASGDVVLSTDALGEPAQYTNRALNAVPAREAFMLMDAEPSAARGLPSLRDTF